MIPRNHRLAYAFLVNNKRFAHGAVFASAKKNAFVRQEGCFFVKKKQNKLYNCALERQAVGALGFQRVEFISIHFVLDFCFCSHVINKIRCRFCKRIHSPAVINLHHVKLEIERENSITFIPICID